VGWQHGRRIIEQLSMRAYDDVGEVAEDWPEATKADVEKLDDMISEAIEKWMDETANRPAFYELEEIQEHEPIDAVSPTEV
jgi:hypothetical protein